MSTPLSEAWHEVVERGDRAALHELLAEDACFHSPVVHRPQQGRALTELCLGAAIDGVEINGVDMIRWDTEGRICDFKVMVRPWKGIEKLREKMAAMLEQLKSA